jgi:hypothetical protein
VSDEPHYATMVRCNCCTNEWAAVFPESTDVTELECPSCGAQNSELITVGEINNEER